MECQLSIVETSSIELSMDRKMLLNSSIILLDFVKSYALYCQDIKNFVDLPVASATIYNQHLLARTPSTIT